MILYVCPNPAIDQSIKINVFDIGKINKASAELSYLEGRGVHVAGPMGVEEKHNQSC